MGTFSSATSSETFTIEDFENSPLAPNDVETSSPIISSTSSDLCFPAGNLQPGFSMSTVQGGITVILATGFFGVPNNAVGANSFAEDTQIDFSPSVDAVSFELISPLDPTGTIFTVEAFDGATSLGTTDVMSNINTPVFLGLTTVRNLEF